MSIKRTGYQTDRISASAVPARSIASDEVALVQRAMSAIAPNWSVETQATDDATVIVLPEDGDDAAGPTFMISRETYGFRLDQVHWDVLTEVGFFASMNDVVAALDLHLACGTAAGAPASATLH